MIIGMNVPSVIEFKGPLSTTPLFLFNYMLQFGYYILFGACRNEGNHCETTTDNKTPFRNAIYSIGIRFCYTRQYQ